MSPFYVLPLLGGEGDVDTTNDKIQNRGRTENFKM